VSYLSGGENAVAHQTSAYVGPYAEFLVPKGGPKYLEGDRASGSVEIALLCAGLSLYPATETRDGMCYTRIWFFSGSDASTASSFDENGATDLSNVNPQDEIARFREVKRAALQYLAAYYGSEPRICWGLVWYDDHCYFVNHAEPVAAPDPAT
jgi:hypothetical protein